MSHNTFMLLVEKTAAGLAITDGHGNDCSHQHSKLTNHDSFCWIPRSGSLTINFPKGHPFLSAPQAAQVVNVDPKAAPSSYDYNLTLKAAGEEPLVEDPQVIIDDGKDTDVDLSVASDAQTVFQGVLNGLTAAKGDPDRLFFPNGIELISVTVKAAPPDVEITVSGPKPGN